MKAKDIQKLLQTWKKRLRLQDWELELHIVRRYRTRDGGSGSCEIVPNYKSAVITITHRDDFGSEDRFDRDFESTLVHELLHLHVETFADQDAGETRDTLKEQAIVSLERAFMALGRVIPLDDPRWEKLPLGSITEASR